MSCSRVIALLLTAMFFLTSQIAAAQDVSAGRYAMHPAGEGFLRLDTVTGAVSHCQKKESWVCVPVEGATDTDREKIVSLEQENINLRNNIRLLEELLKKQGYTGSFPDTPSSDVRTPGFRLPSEQEVDKALNYFENMLKKFQERLKSLEQDEAGQNEQSEKTL